VAHLYGSIESCVRFPSAMRPLVQAAQVLALDVGRESRVPCALAAFTYYDELVVVALAPLVVSLAALGLCFAWVRARRQRRTRRKFGEVAAQRARGEKSIWHKALWKAAPAVLFFIDVSVPTITRKLWGFLQCQDLGAAGSFLKADFAVRRGKTFFLR
jgi:hypothetical protein